jgi:MucR family transcriptional regulator, transcriptional regulator of exopolysaccharide biosynthesis
VPKNGRFPVKTAHRFTAAPLRTHYDLTPERYREKWGLPPDYPMVAPNYAVARSKLARQMGLGQRPRGK